MSRWNRRNNRKRWQKPKQNYLQNIKFNSIFVLIIWIVFCFCIPFLYNIFSFIINPLSFIFYLISFVFGVYYSYKFVMWIDRKLPNSEFGIWIRRIISTLMIIFGLGSAALLMATTTFVTSTSKSDGGSIFGVNLFMTLIISFLFCFAVFASYIEFTFERKSGILVFHDRQRF